MTTDIERQFFDTFGIEPKLSCKPWECPQYGAHGRDKCVKKLCAVDEDCWKNKEYTSAYYEYPQITDRILLELICINAKSQDMYQDYYRIRSRNYDNLKFEILGDCMCEREDIKQQVQSLFKEG